MTKKPRKIPDKKLRELLIKAIEKDEYFYCEHALEQMEKRKISLPLALKALEAGYREKPKDNIDQITGEWRYAIKYCDDELKAPIRQIITFNKTLNIITIMWVEK